MRELLLRRRALLMAQGVIDDKFKFVIDTRLGTSTTFVVPFTNGTYTTINEFIIDWGDGETTTINKTFTTANRTHNYAENGRYTITFYNVDKICPPLAFGANSPYAPMLIKYNMKNAYRFVATNGNYNLTIPTMYLYGCVNLTSKIYIPDYVTSLGASAFRLCNLIRGVPVIPATVSSIGQLVFYQCVSLDGVVSYIQSPVATGSAVFAGVKDELHVPAGTAAAYAALADWNRFKNIIDDL